MEWRLFIVVLMVPFLASCGMAQQMQINAVADTAVEVPVGPRRDLCYDEANEYALHGLRKHDELPKLVADPNG